MRNQWRPNSNFAELYRDPAKTPLFEALSPHERGDLLERLRFGAFPLKTLSELGFAGSPKAAAGGCILIRPSATNGSSTSSGRWLRDADVPAASAHCSLLAGEQAARAARIRSEQEPILRAIREAKKEKERIKLAAAQARQAAADELMRKRRERMRPKALKELADRPQWLGSLVLTLPAGPELTGALPALPDPQARWGALGIGPWSKAPAEFKALAKDCPWRLRAPEARLPLRGLSEITTSALIGARLDACSQAQSKMSELMGRLTLAPGLEFLSGLGGELDAIASELPGAHAAFPKLAALQNACHAISKAARGRSQLLAFLALARSEDSPLARAAPLSEAGALLDLAPLRAIQPWLYARGRWGGCLGAFGAAFDPASAASKADEASSFLADMAKDKASLPRMAEAFSSAVEQLRLDAPDHEKLRKAASTRRNVAFGFPEAMELFPEAFAHQCGGPHWFSTWRRSLGERFGKPQIHALARAYLKRSATRRGGSPPAHGIALWCVETSMSWRRDSAQIHMRNAFSSGHHLAMEAGEEAFALADLADELGAFHGADASAILAEFFIAGAKSGMRGMHPKLLAVAERRALRALVKPLPGPAEREPRRL